MFYHEGVHESEFGNFVQQLRAAKCIKRHGTITAVTKPIFFGYNKQHGLRTFLVRINNMGYGTTITAVTFWMCTSAISSTFMQIKSYGIIYNIYSDIFAHKLVRIEVVIPQ